MSWIRRNLPYVLGVAGLVLGLVLGLAIGSDDDDGGELTGSEASVDEEEQLDPTGALAPACREALELATNGMGAAVQAASLAQASANAPEGQPGAPSQESVNQLATQVQAMRQQVQTARAACEAGASSARISSTTTTAP